MVIKDDLINEWNALASNFPNHILRRFISLVNQLIDSSSNWLGVPVHLTKRDETVEKRANFVHD